MNFLIVSLIALFLLFVTVIVHYYVLRRLTVFIKRESSGPSAVVVIVMVLFFTHFIEVLVYALFYYFAGTYTQLDVTNGTEVYEFNSAIYLSLLSYSSLGFSGIQPIGALRFIAGFEALNGLLLITWSASFTFLAMGKLWECHSCFLKTNIPQAIIDSNNERVSKE